MGCDNKKFAVTKIDKAGSNGSLLENTLPLLIATYISQFLRYHTSEFRVV